MRGKFFLELVYIREYFKANVYSILIHTLFYNDQCTETGANHPHSFNSERVA
jgi:hypothetical protein